MSQMSVAPQNLHVVPTAQAASVPGEDAGSAAVQGNGADFASVLKAHIAEPAKDAAETGILAALLPPQAGEDGTAAAADPSAGAVLAALLPAMAAIPPANTEPTEEAVSALETLSGLPAVMQPISVAAASLLQPPAPGDSAVVPAGHSAAATSPDSVTATMTASSKAADPAGLIADARRQPLAIEGQPAAADTSVTPAQAHLAAPLAHSRPAGEAPAVARLDTPVGARGWDAEVGQKVVWMVNRSESRAELTLTPPQMGKVDVTLSVSGDQTHASFVAASPAAREALEQALPRLREILADAGITLGQASVNAETPRRDAEASPSAGRSDKQGVDAPRSTATTQWVRRGSGLIDTFA